MDALIQKKYFSGRAKPGIWSSVYTYKPQNSELRRIRGEIFAVICLKGPAEFDLEVAGNMLLDKLHESYFENKEDSTLIALEKALLVAGGYLQQFLEKDTENGNKGVDLNIMTLVMLGDVVYLVTLGAGKVFALRDGIISELSDSLKDPTGEGFLAEASLIAKKGDVFIIGTPQLKKELTSDELESASADFSDLGFKSRTYIEEAATSMMMIGFGVNRNQEKQLPAQALEDAAAAPEGAVDEVADIEAQEEDAATMALEVGHEEDIADFDEEATLEDLVRKDQVGPEIEADADLATEPADLKEEDDFEEVLIDETAEVTVDPDTRFPSKMLNKTKSGFSKLLQGAQGLFAKKATTEAITEVQIPEDILAEPLPEADLKAIKPVERGDAGKKTYQVFVQKLGLSLKQFGQKIKALVWDKWLGMKVDTNNPRLKTAAQKRKWGLVIILVLILLGVIYISIDNSATLQQQKAALEKNVNSLTEAKALIDEVNSRTSVYAKLGVDDARKSQPLAKLAEAQTKLDSAKANPELTDEIAQQEQLIAVIKAKFEKTIQIYEEDFLIDMGTLFPEIQIIDMAVANKTIYLLPSAEKVSKIYSISYSGADLKEINVDLVNPQSIVADDKGNLIVLDQNPERGIVIINPADGSSNRIAASSSSVLAGATQIDFSVINGQGRIYLIRPNDKSISFYSRSGSSYSTITKRNTLEELATAKDLVVIDGKIYLIMKTKEGLYRDYGKESENILLKGMKSGDNLLGASALHVDGTYIYVADPSKKRVVVLIKDVVDLPLVAQYAYKGNSNTAWTDMKEVIADRDAMKIFLLDKARVYALNMNQLSEFIN